MRWEIVYMRIWFSASKIFHQSMIPFPKTKNTLLSIEKHKVSKMFLSKKTSTKLERIETSPTANLDVQAVCYVRRLASQVQRCQPFERHFKSDHSGKINVVPCCQVRVIKSYLNQVYEIQSYEYNSIRVKRKCTSE